VRWTEPLADVALMAGFADQSHMTRALRRSTGTTPAGLRRLFTPGGG
jgi:AraC-like DNA-binding protein